MHHLGNPLDSFVYSDLPQPSSPSAKGGRCKPATSTCLSQGAVRLTPPRVAPPLVRTRVHMAVPASSVPVCEICGRGDTRTSTHARARVTGDRAQLRHSICRSSRFPELRGGWCLFSSVVASTFRHSSKAPGPALQGATPRQTAIVN